ncbi:MAG TPA: SAM-dependent methyltransferase [Trebonia sp.]|nr:SAM-dependent methyltransferase [Trebonia sp.]
MSDQAPGDSVPDVDTSRPHPARMYDYYLGGKNHFAADREAAERALLGLPSGRIAARENRKFLGRAVRYLAAEAGIRQFLDLGSGLPTTDNVHEVAQRIAPEAHVVYVDKDPMVLAHARALLTSTQQGRTAYIDADVRDPDAILDHPATRGVLDFREPVALIMVALVHFLSDEDKPWEIVSALLDPMPPGSYIVASSLTAEHDPEGVGRAAQAYRDAGLTAVPRDADDFARVVFRNLEMVPPGVVILPDWRPDTSEPRPSAAEVSGYGGVARKE